MYVQCYFLWDYCWIGHRQFSNPMVYMHEGVYLHIILLRFVVDTVGPMLPPVLTISKSYHFFVGLNYNMSWGKMQPHLPRNIIGISGKAFLGTLIIVQWWQYLCGYIYQDGDYINIINFVILMYIGIYYRRV